MARHEILTLQFQDLNIGDEWVSLARTITETDVVQFAGLSGDYNPIHVDHESARLGPFGKPIAHGLLGLAIASGLASQAPRVATLAFLGLLEWTFRQPIVPGDTIRVLTRAEELEPRARGRRGIVTWRRQILNQHGVIVQEGRTQTMVLGRGGDPSTSDTTTDQAID